jgi:hypothetical protein
MLMLALAGGLLTLVLLAKPTQAQGQGATSEKIPQEFTLDASECAGELIIAEGTLHVVNHVKARPDGSYHINSHFILVMKGIGLTTGEEYVIPGVSNSVDNFVHPGQTVTGTMDINLNIGKGQLPNDVAFLRIFFVIDDEGEVKVANTQFHFECHE